MFQIRCLHSTQPPSLQRILTIPRPHLEYCVPPWSPYYVKDKELIERIQHTFTRMFPELRKLPYLRRLEYLKLWTLEEWRARADLIEVYKSNLRHHFFSKRVINNWNNLDNKTVMSGSINIFKGNLKRIKTVKRDRSVCWQLMLYRGRP